MKSELKVYWESRGKRYYREFRSKARELRLRYRHQESEFRRVLDGLPPVESVLELACGFGRMTEVLRNAFPKTQIVAYDLSQAQIDRAKALVRGVDFRVGDVTSLDLDRDFDLIVASEFYMHLPNPDFNIVMDHVAKWSLRFAINIDVTAADTLLPTESGLAYQFEHDYVEAYRRRGFRTMKEVPLWKQTIFVEEKEVGA